LFSGIIPALLTPFTPEDRVDTAALCNLIEFVLSHDVNGLYLCGSSGEGLLLTEEERCLVAETAIKQTQGRVPVLVHVGTTSTPSAERLARHAREVGADAVAAVPPFYYPVERRGIEVHYRRISHAAGLPLYLYNIPNATNVNVRADLVQRLFQEEVIQGVKYTSYDQLSFREIVEACGPRLNIFAGPDEMLLPFLVMGAHGGIGTTYNCMPHLFVSLYEAWCAHDIEKAQQLQYQVDRIILVLAQYGVIPAVKAAMHLLGVDCGAPRAPLLPLTEEQQEQMGQALQAEGFFSLAEGEENRAR
jgi:N-acetylneuraminate lyase